MAACGSSRPVARFWEWGRTIVCVGRNYAEHAREMQAALPAEPVYFLKAASAYVREGSPIVRPASCRELHHEVELGVVVGSSALGVPEEAAMAHVAGYALCLDMTARDTQAACKRQGLPWTPAKAFRTSCPVSDFIPKEKVPDPHRLHLWLRVNGQLRQEGSTADMLFSVPFLLSYISRTIALEPGDLLLTGTPKGVASVQPGDEIEAGIQGLVSMRFTVEEQK
ncbi:acylpyruvase FAHD1, mitochondrial [Heteronotia binoei]|uniref:acylpyruvase FAHD1, mitochondrial n=1 Tax=Heteronotia binoei TaxID=13085 RepID=UPI00292CF450|nr:acylpyruvase FAHD1, mitochondrial [Heteronotia binoei]